MAVSFPRRVVVTGIGAISPLGKTMAETWGSLLNNECGMTTLEETLVEHQALSEKALERELKMAKSLPCQVAAPVRGLEYDNRTARFVQMAIVAGSEAVQHARLDAWLGEDNPDDEASVHRRERVGVCVGSGMSGVREIAEALHTVEDQGLRRLSPHFVPKVLTNSAAGRLSLEYGLRGPNHSASTACAAGSHAIGDAMRCIQYNNADIMLAGGAEACIDPLSMAGFSRLRALSTGFSPQESSRPFDRQRDGFVMGEGASMLVLEELNHALERGAPILAELCGYGLSGDAFHITAPDAKGRGAERAMAMALAQANSDGSEVGYVNAHATSTPKGDEIEIGVIDRALPAERRNSDDRLLVSSTKGATGHLLGAAGALEAAFTVMSLVDQTVPPTRNLQETDEGSPVGFEHVQETQKVDNLSAAMSNSFGFGGTNASLLFRRYDNK
jgi:3-oxoacyl-[acyl-carrier-protein] synthase II